MKAYRVRFWHQDEDGREDFMEFDTMEQAIEFYDFLDGLAEVQMYDETRCCYESTLYPTFEF